MAPKSKKEKKEFVPLDQRPLVIKVSQKKAVSIYNINRFPVTLYAEQWTRLLNHSGEIRNFIELNRGELASKSDNKKEELSDSETEDINNIEDEIIPIN